jgi:uncharacterized membrane protein
MAPLIVLTVVFGIGLALRAAHVKHLRDWRTALRYALATMFTLTAWAHFGSRRAELVRMVPPFFPNPEFLVTFTGVAEILGAIGLLVPRFAPAAAVGLTLLLLAVFPANVYAALNGLTLAGGPVTDLLPRALMQVVFLAATITAAARSRRQAPRPPRSRYVRTPGASWPVSSTYSE